MNAPQQNSEEQLCWFFTILNLIPVKKLHDIKMKFSLKKLVNARYLQRLTEKRILAHKPNAWRKNQANYKHQLFILKAIEDHLETVKKMIPNIDCDWNVVENEKDISTEYALLALFYKCDIRCSYYSFLDDLQHSNESVECDETELTIYSYYFDALSHFKLPKCVTILELTIDIGMQHLHSVLLFKNHSQWYVLDCHYRKALPLSDMKRNKFRIQIDQIIDTPSHKYGTFGRYKALHGILFIENAPIAE